jgi:hypothetical protein
MKVVNVIMAGLWGFLLGFAGVQAYFGNIGLALAVMCGALFVIVFYLVLWIIECRSK